MTSPEPGNTREWRRSDAPRGTRPARRNVKVKRSPGFTRAARRERDRLRRTRDRLATQRDQLDRTIADLDRQLATLDLLLAREDAGGTPRPHGSDSPVNGSGQRLQGSAIRHTAVQVLLAQPSKPEALHYRDWYELVQRAGYTIVGENPLAVFLTQLSRSPLIVRSTASGVYAIDPDAPQRLQARVTELAEHLRRHLHDRADPTAERLSDPRHRISAAQTRLARVERDLAEATAALRARDPDGVEIPVETAGREPQPDMNGHGR